MSGRHQAIGLLESMVEPSAQLAEGFAVVAVTTNAGEELLGTRVREDDQAIVLRIGEEEQTVLKSEVGTLRLAPSTMPNMRSLLGRQELRDLVAYLKTL